MNARLFFHSEEIPAAIKPYRTFQKEKKLEGNDLSGTVFEGYHYISYADKKDREVRAWGEVVGSDREPYRGYGYHSFMSTDSEKGS
ncbi:hypothetical protein Tco_0867090 [Tanacetum coccineum]